jgi:hypothetical protein
MTFFAAIKKAEGPIPDLRPPKGRIAFDVPEAAIFNSALIVAFVVLIIGRILHVQRPQPPRPVDPPLVLARRALEAASGPTLVEDCVQIVRRYLRNAFGVGWEGATASELCAAFAAHPQADSTTLAAIESYFAESDLSRFAPHEEQELAETCVSRALQLVEQLEARRVVTEPPALPIAT